MEPRETFLSLFDYLGKAAGCELGKKVASEKESVEKLREELIKKLGTEEEGQVFIKIYDEVKDEEGNTVSRSLTSKFIEFKQEY